MSRIPRIRRMGAVPGAATPVRDAAASATVTVKFTLDSQGNPGFDFSTGGNTTGDLEMASGTDTITFQLDSASTSGYHIHNVHFTLEDDAGPAEKRTHKSGPFSGKEENGNYVVIDHDDIPVTGSAEVYCYQVTVKRDGHDKRYTSPDPKITNSPPAQPPL